MIDQLAFSKTGLRGEDIGIQLKGDVLERFFNGHLTDEVFQPAVSDWQRFSDALTTINVWSWKEEYFDPYILDGTQWELELRDGPKEIISSGSNLFPEQFDEFVESVNQLVGEELF